MQTRRDEEEIHRLSSDIKYGKHSQPTTPPEYSDSNGFPTALSRPNRFSLSSIASPAGMSTRGSRSGSLLTSPPSVASTQTTQTTQGGGAQGGGAYLPSKSVPGSGRNSDEENDFEDDDFTPLSPVYRK
jgi:hypothetical protein